MELLSATWVVIGTAATAAVVLPAPRSLTVTVTDQGWQKVVCRRSRQRRVGSTPPASGASGPRGLLLQLFRDDSLCRSVSAANPVFSLPSLGSPFGHLSSSEWPPAICANQGRANTDGGCDHWPLFLSNGYGSPRSPKKSKTLFGYSSDRINSKNLLRRKNYKIDGDDYKTSTAA
jgi:hypothetical protein